MRAFIEPTFAFQRDKNGSREFISIVGRAMTSADPVVRDHFLALVHPLIDKLHQSLCLALPQLPADLIFTRLFFTMGAMGHCIGFSGMAQMFRDKPEPTPEDDVFMTNSLITFVTAGLEASC